MANMNRIKLAGSFLAVVLAGGAVQGCSAAEDGVCEFDAQIEGFTASVDGLVQAEAELRAELAYACAQIAGDYSVGQDNDATSDDVTALCGSASVAIEAQVDAGEQPLLMSPVTDDAPDGTHWRSWRASVPRLRVSEVSGSLR